jgi:hypothetical protein
MQNLRVIYANIWRDGVMLGASSEDAQYPAESTQDDDTSFVWRSAAAALTPTIDVDLGVAAIYDYIALLNHNFTSGATIQIKGADDSAFSSNVVTDTLTFNGVNLREFLAAARTKRYVRISIADASNPSNYIQIGTIIVGKYVDLGSPIMATGYEDGASADSEIAESASGNAYLVLERASLDTMAFQLRIAGASADTYKAAIIDMIKASQAVWAIDFIFDYTTPNTGGNAMWAIIVSINRVVYAHVNYWTWAVEIKASS